MAAHALFGAASVTVAVMPAVIWPASTPSSSTAAVVGALGTKVVGNQLVNGAGQTVRLIGLNATGTEDACVSGSSYSWGPFDEVEAAEIASWGANAVRVPLNEDCWLGINGAPLGYPAWSYRAAIKQWVSELNAAGLEVILDLQWSAPGSLLASRQWPMPDRDHSVAFWHRVAHTFASDPSVMFDLFSEPALGGSRPSDTDWTCWLHGCTLSYQYSSPTGGTTTVVYQSAGMQSLVKAIRTTGATQPILVAGLNWAGDPCGVYDSTPPSGCMVLADLPNDPAGQLAVSFHSYAAHLCSNESCWNSSVLPPAQQLPMITTEFGESNCSSSYDRSYMSWADSHSISYLAWAWEAQSSNFKGTCQVLNNSLLSDWNGQPSTPAGTVIRAHFLSLP